MILLRKARLVALVASVVALAGCSTVARQTVARGEKIDADATLNIAATAKQGDRDPCRTPKPGEHLACAWIDQQPAEGHSDRELEQSKRRPSRDQEELELERRILVDCPGIRTNREGKRDHEEEKHASAPHQDEQDWKQQVVLREKSHEPQRELRRKEPLVTQESRHDDGDHGRRPGGGAPPRDRGAPLRSSEP